MTLTALAFLAAYAYGLLKSLTSDPRWGLYTYIGVFYLHPPMRWWGQGLPEFRWSLLAALVALVSIPNAKLSATSSTLTSHTLAKVIFAYVIWMWMQLPWANPKHMEGLILMTKYLVLLYLMFRLFREERDLVDFAVAHVAGCFYFGWLTLDAAGGGRLENLGGPGVADSNTLGMHMTTGLMFAASLVLTQTGWRRWGTLLAVPLIANCIMQTESRGAFLGALCGGAVYWYFSAKQHRRLVVVLGLMSVMVLAAYAPAEYWERMNTIKYAAKKDEEKADNSAMSRYVVAAAQWRMFTDHPFGVGFDTTTYLSPQYLANQWMDKGGRASHNTVLTILTDQGAPGILLGMAGVFSVLGLMTRLKRLISPSTQPELRAFFASISASLTVAFVAGQFTNYFKAEIQLWCLALLLVCLQIAQSRLVATQDTDTAQRGAPPLPAARARG